MKTDFLSASEFNESLDAGGSSVFSEAARFTGFLQATTKAAFVEPFATCVCTTLVELYRKGQKVTQADIHDIADAIVFGGYSGNIQSGKTIEDIRKEVMNASSGCLGALHEMRSFSGEGSDKVAALLAELERNQRPLTVAHLHQLAGANTTNRRLCGMLGDAEKCFGRGLTASDTLGDVPMTEIASVRKTQTAKGDVPMTKIVSVGETETTKMVMEMLKAVAQRYGSGPHKEKLEKLIQKCEKECNTLADHQKAIDALTSFGGGLGSGRMDSALREMSQQLSRIALGGQKEFNADQILAHIPPSPTSATHMSS